MPAPAAQMRSPEHGGGPPHLPATTSPAGRPRVHPAEGAGRGQKVRRRWESRRCPSLETEGRPGLETKLGADRGDG